MRRNQHIYTPPQGNRYLRFLIPVVGSIIFTFLVFYVIPLMKKLDAEPPAPPAAYEEASAPPPPPEVDDSPPPPPPPPPDRIKEPPPELPDIDIPVAISGLGGGPGSFVLDIDTKFEVAGNEDIFQNENETLPPKPVTRSAPRYPNALKKKGIEGSVEVGATISETGSVTATRVKTSSGYPAMDRAATQAVGRWRFKPGVKGGRKVEANVAVVINFKLSR